MSTESDISSLEERIRQLEIDASGEPKKIQIGRAHV